ncbi:hypothetical protein [Deminuibacter soli]|uniref:hypothetical protein n=1 Tax=Deminuibacter soli TaxID=2291815 RepID=UPI0013149170|nr:hypothetical protein [Deminuibacter soli]
MQLIYPVITIILLISICFNLAYILKQYKCLKKTMKDQHDLLNSIIDKSNR